MGFVHYVVATISASTALRVPQRLQKSQHNILNAIAALERKVFAKHVSWADEVHNAAQRRNTVMWYMCDGDTLVVAYVAATVSALCVTIHRLAVLPEFRRQGLASQLIKVCGERCARKRVHHPLCLHQCVCTNAHLSSQAAVHDILKQRSIITVALHVDPDNTPAVTLYCDKLGFVRDGVVEDYYGPGRPAWRLMVEVDRKTWS